MLVYNIKFDCRSTCMCHVNFLWLNRLIIQKNWKNIWCKLLQGIEILIEYTFIFLILKKYDHTTRLNVYFDFISYMYYVVHKRNFKDSEREINHKLIKLELHQQIKIPTVPFWNVTISDCIFPRNFCMITKWYTYKEKVCWVIYVYYQHSNFQCKQVELFFANVLFGKTMTIRIVCFVMLNQIFLTQSDLCPG